MAEIFGNGGQTVEASGQYECSECGYRQTFEQGSTFPDDHHAGKPWTLYLATQELPGQQTA